MISLMTTWASTLEEGMLRRVRDARRDRRKREDVEMVRSRMMR
jgi:hypothetical protein